LLRLSDEVRDALLANRIREGHARALLGLPDVELQRHALKAVESRGLSVRQTEELVRRLTAEEHPPEKASSPRDPQTSELEDRFRRVLGTKVNLYRGTRGGRLVIHFFSEEELQALFDLIVGEDL
jgi:ParB family chromosome partitioning protein